MDKDFCTDNAGNRFERTENSSFFVHFGKLLSVLHVYAQNILHCTITHKFSMKNVKPFCEHLNFILEVNVRDGVVVSFLQIEEVYLST